MSFNTFGRVFRFSTWGESHGPAIGAMVDGCPPGLPLTEADIQPFLDKRKPGTSKFTTQRREADEVRILSGVFEGRTTGTPISLMIENTDQRSKDYSEVAKAYRRSEEHTSELQSLMRISYAVFCLKKKKNSKIKSDHHKNIDAAE